MKIPLVDLKAQYVGVADEALEAITSVMQTTQFILGDQVKAFEEEFAAFCGARFCVGVANGTDAIQLACRASGIGPGDEVIIPANTFIATLIGVHQAGARPVLVDCNESDFLIDPGLIEQAITPRTKAIIPVHLYGQCADMDAIKKVAAKHNLLIIEDAAQAHGAMCGEAKAGAIGTIGCFSFYPGKNLGAYGDAGGCTTDSLPHAEKLRLLRNLGSVRKYDHEIFGINSRLDKWNEARREHAAYYSKKLSNIPNVITPRVREDRGHVFHLYVIRVPERDRVLSYLHQQGIGAVIHYPIPPHLSPAFAHLGYTQGSFPITEKLAAEVLSLPLYPELTRAQMDTVIEQLTIALS
jgi:dTDP-4-amino-4,6-dideoxygalactose transaminase